MKNRITFIGSGSPGGKGSGLVRIQSFIDELYPEGKYGNITLGIPDTVIILSDVFEIFIAENDLYLEHFDDSSDEQISLSFNRASFPPLLLSEIRNITDSFFMNTPF